jgi:hypothetical protein
MLSQILNYKTQYCGKKYGQLGCIMKTLISVLVLIFLTVMPVAAEEGILCDSYYNDVQRKVGFIKSFGTDLSEMTKQTLFDDLEIDTKLCISECEGEKFKYCNEIAKWIENH